jgi:DNA-binding winged helix-turn-helix (wHTH) protein
MPRAENKEDLYFGPFHLSLVKRALWLGDGLVDLSPTEFEVLLALVESKSGALSAESLRTAAWHGQAVELNNVHQVIRRLRQKLGPDEDGRQYIVRNQAGYVLAANITSKGPQNAKENGPELADPAPEQRAVAESSVGIEVNGRAASHHGVPSPSDPSARPYDQPAPRAKPLGRSASLLALALLGIPLSLLLVIAFHSHSPERHFVLQMKQLTIDGRAKGGPLVFDGGRLWFTEVLQGAWKVVSVAAAGGEAQPLNVPFKETFIWGKSGDGSELLLLSINEGEKKTWAWRLGGDDLRLLRSKPFTPSIESPDSQMTAFSDGNALVFARGGRVINRAVTPQGTVVSQIQWSPDSSHVSFALANNRLALATLFLADPFTSQAPRDR